MKKRTRGRGKMTKTNKQTSCWKRKAEVIDI